MTHIRTLISTALNTGEIDQLLLGVPKYAYRSRFVPCPRDSDIVEFLQVMVNEVNTVKLRTELDRVLNRMVDTYEGVFPVASCILFETARRSRGETTLNLDTHALAAALSNTIDRFRDRLAIDFSFEGANWPDGQLGDLRRLSRVTASLGGPTFCGGRRNA